jgi:hypothetical protein
MITYSRTVLPADLAKKQADLRRDVLRMPQISDDVAVRNALRTVDAYTRGLTAEQAADVRSQFYQWLRFGHRPHDAARFAVSLISQHAWGTYCLRVFDGGVFGHGVCSLHGDHQGKCYGRGVTYAAFFGER